MWFTLAHPTHGLRIMPLDRPYYRTIRPLVEANNSGWSAGQFMRHPSYAKSPIRFVQGYSMIQRDFADILEYVEADDQNANTFGYRIHELLMRTFVEVEANFKAILRENLFTCTRRWTMDDYSRVENSHRLSGYQVLLPTWRGSVGEFRPFGAWSESKPLPWYDAYNASKHDRHESLINANLRMLVQAIGGLVVLLTAQFSEEDFSGSPGTLLVEGSSIHKWEPAIGGIWRVDHPRDWREDERYAFDWEDLREQDDPFQKFNYDVVLPVAFL
ncbi:MAG: hypothetical protein ACT4N9_12200 [Paracoccaceae bacterium]